MRDLVCSVQRNCDISDAHHAGDATMCIYLMRMREHYKWHKGIPNGESFDHNSLGEWLQKRETYLSSLENSHHSSITLGGMKYDPFDHVEINQQLSKQGLVYCAGYGRGGKPVFCLGEIVGTEHTDDYEMYVIGRELAREMSAPPAMSLGKTIYIRQDAFTRWVWGMFEEWSWHKPHNAFYRAIASFGDKRDPREATHTLAASEIENLILHEIGEVVAGNLLGDGWSEMLHCLTNTPLEGSARAVRDNLADNITVLPALVSNGTTSSLHFYFAGFHSLRSELYPTLKEAYGIWAEGQTLAPLKAVVRRGQEHWLKTAQELVSCYEEHGADCESYIQTVIDRSSL
ncbi:MAG: hypothetical protein QNI91_15445 [Arenicellales bacterium]|nr:hypothetical protein [Arenicellales bacterium]